MRTESIVRVLKLNSILLKRHKDHFRAQYNLILKRNKVVMINLSNISQECEQKGANLLILQISKTCKREFRKVFQKNNTQCTVCKRKGGLAEMCKSKQNSHTSLASSLKSDKNIFFGASNFDLVND